MPPKALTTTMTGSVCLSTILLTLSMLSTEPTDVPPNFITFILARLECHFYKSRAKVQKNEE